MKLKSYSQAYQYLCRFTDYERMAKIHYNQTAYNLKRMRWLLDAIGNPQNKLRCIHIAGTKGKGSTAMMTAQILASAGYSVGLYTSPHLTDLRERIQVWTKNKQSLISEPEFANLMNYLANKIRIPHSHQPTFFELMTALGFLYFARKKTDFAVIEVGLGGRLDATNLITPLVSVITRIDFDHTDKLGNTIKRIAYEKAGIIKKGIPVVTFSQKSAADEVIKHQAKLKNAELFVAEMTETEKLKTKNSLRVLGIHQTENCSLALGVIKVLNRKKYTHINPTAIKSALSKLQLPARLESVTPGIIIDSAHNPLSIRATAETVRKMKYRNLILILAISRDKEIAKMLDIIIPIANIVILTKTNHPRLLQPEEFSKYLPPPQVNKIVLLESDYKKALEMAQRLAGEKDLILITGSFYLAGEMKRIFS
ncbi:MAG: folylpolyglutamate synthase/dihydrofolate synthase family protein [Planctomycetota bacterium]